jgi:hypothetical protein
LNALYRAYQAYEVSNGKPAKNIEDLPLAKSDVEEFKRWLNLDELGLSLADAKKEDLRKSVMVYEKQAPREGGLVMFYDGSIQALSATEVARVLGITPPAPLQEPGAKPDVLAREAVDQFFKAFKKRDVDGLLMVVDVPFCREGGKDIEKRDELKQFFQKALERRDPSRDTFTFQRVTTLPEWEKSEGKFTDAERKTLEKVLGKEHRLVRVEWNRVGDSKHKTLILVRLQKGKARVVGIL